MALLGPGTLGVTGEYGAAGTFFALKVTSGAAGITDTIHCYCYNNNAAAREVKMAIYSHDSGNNRPLTQLAAEVAIVVPGLANETECSAAYTATIAAATIYWIAWVPDDTDDVYSHYETTGTDSLANISGQSYDLPVTWPGGSDLAADYYSYWAEYTEGGGGSGLLVPIAMMYYGRMRR